MFAVSPTSRILSPMEQSTRCAQTVHCSHTNSIIPALCETLNRSECIWGLRCPQVSQIPSCTMASGCSHLQGCSFKVLLEDPWIMTPHSSNEGSLSKERAPDTDATGNRMSSQGRDVGWEYPAKRFELISTEVLNPSAPFKAFTIPKFLVLIRFWLLWLFSAWIQFQL